MLDGIKRRLRTTRSSLSVPLFLSPPPPRVVGEGGRGDVSKEKIERLMERER